jgi:hypothetical protein
MCCGSKNNFFKNLGARLTYRRSANPPDSSGIGKSLWECLHVETRADVRISGDLLFIWGVVSVGIGPMDQSYKISKHIRRQNLSPHVYITRFKLFFFLLIFFLMLQLVHIRCICTENVSCSGVARPQATGALARGVEEKILPTVAILHCSTLFDTVALLLAWGVHPGWLRYWFHVLQPLEYSGYTH